MDFEVVVVGAGIGGLTVAALLAHRGMSVCVLERQSQVGGCAASFDKFGFRFEQGHGLYSSWEPGGIHQRIFAELPVGPPETLPLDPAFIIRLPDRSEVSVGSDGEAFEQNLREVFPESAANAIEFYRKLDRMVAQRAGGGNLHSEPFASAGESTASHLTGVSPRFRQFIDAQLQILTHGNSNEVGLLQAALSTNEARRQMFAIRGGSAALANKLADSIKLSGGTIRLDAPVLRLGYDSTGEAVGVDLLSGERVMASKAIISNLTLWDTYGKLVGLNRTPPEIRKQLQRLRGWGAYLVFGSIESDAANLPAADRFLALTSWQPETPYSPETQQLFLNVAPAGDRRAPEGKRAATIHAFTRADDWFSFHTDEEETEAKDQRMLESVWEQLHRSMPELGSSIEVIDTINPRGYYDTTRRKLGMVGGVIPTPDWSQGEPRHTTSLPNLFIVSETTAGGGLATLSRAALTLANKLRP